MSLNAQGMNRRNFLRASATGAAGLLIGFYFHSEADLLAEAAEAQPGAPIMFNAWIRVGTDDYITILIDKSEMGQSILTGLAMIAADELDCDWTKVRTEFAPAEKVYYNPRFGVQGTGGSSGTPTSWNPLRKASATARAMLLQAAAQKWGVDVSTCRAENSVVLHDATKRLANIRKPCGSRSEIIRAAGRTAQNSRSVSAHRQADCAPGHAAQGKRHGAIRD